jgi:signal transduction histidine kinase
VRATREAAAGAEAVRLSVHDSGIGIAAGDLERLFEPFVQLDGGLGRRYGGTGLGLALVKRLAELQDGSVAVQSELGAGSTFSIFLPLARLGMPCAAGAT